MSNSVAEAQAKINLAMKLLLEAQQLLDAQTDVVSTAASTASVASVSEAPPPKPTRASSKKEAITALFAATLIQHPNDEALTEQLKLVMHSSVASNKHALASLVRFNWSRLSAQKNHYLQDPTVPSSFSINREQPVPNQPTATIKVFLDAPNRNPTPCTLQQEHDGSWKVLTFSL